MNLWEILTAKLYKWYQGHDGVADAHHTPYTDADAVAAVDTDDAYLKNTGDTCNGGFIISDNTYPQFTLESLNNYAILDFKSYNAGSLASQMRFFGHKYVNNEAYIQSGKHGANAGNLSLTGLYGGAGNILKFKFNTIDFDNHAPKNLKNHAASALSGTKKLIEIDIGGTPYYFEVYPTKA